ncbi:MAG: 50S ribosomal protein L4 [Bacillota bacterium]|nr:50S ribosomal protein L4 [Bacillota bacterium]
MAKGISLPVVTLKGEEAGKIELSSKVFGVTDPNTQAIHDAVVVYQANLRQATAKTKKRHEVSGGGKKPYRQKGTGRARAGSRRSPIFVGGGTVFGPDGNQNYKLSQNKKEHNLALRTVLSEKVKAKKLIVVDSLKVEKVSTSEFAGNLKAIKAEGKTLLVIDNYTDEKSFEEVKKLVLSAQNIATVGLVETDNIAVYDVLNFDNIVISKDSVKKVEEALQ